LHRLRRDRDALFGEVALLLGGEMRRDREDRDNADAASAARREITETMRYSFAKDDYVRPGF
jgi:hypothetical protein